MKSFKKLAVVGVVCATGSSLTVESVHAQVINATSVRAASGFFAGVAVDAATGAAYELSGYGPGYSGGSNPTTLRRYANAASFEAGVGGTIITSGTNFWGTYMAAQSGAVYGRSSSAFDGYGWPLDAMVSKIDGTTGAVQATANVAGMGGTNGTHTFDWGGFSGVNAMNDGSRLYVVGGNLASSDWRIATFDYNLNQLNAATFTSAVDPGWGFAINGSIFIGDDFYSGQISQRVDAATGAVTNVNFTVTGIGGYTNNVTYDAYGDTLYFNSEGGIFKVASASSAFGVASPVPEPETYAMMVAGLGLLAFVSRRRRKVNA